IAGVWRALKPGGRFVGEFGGYGNVATIVAALESALGKRGIDAKTINPWYNPSAAEYRRLLESALQRAEVHARGRKDQCPGRSAGRCGGDLSDGHRGGHRPGGAGRGVRGIPAGRDSVEKVEGTGLGLAISRKFIELHGGKIWVKSHVGIG